MPAHLLAACEGPTVLVTLPPPLGHQCAGLAGMPPCAVSNTLSYCSTHPMGAFLHSARTAPIITLFVPGTPLKTTHLQKRA